MAKEQAPKANAIWIRIKLVLMIMLTLGTLLLLGKAAKEESLQGILGMAFALIVCGVTLFFIFCSLPRKSKTAPQS